MTDKPQKSAGQPICTPNAQRVRDKDIPHESLLSFPCDFPIKAFGHSRDDFDLIVAEIVRRHAPELGDNAIARRSSKGGKFTAITITVRAVSQAQLDAIYRDLSASADVIMAL